MNSQYKNGETENETHRPTGCVCSPVPEGCYDAILAACTTHDKLISRNESHEIFNMNSLLGEKINFLYETYGGSDLSNTNKAEFYYKADYLRSLIDCEDGIYDQYSEIIGSSILSPVPSPEVYIVPY